MKRLHVINLGKMGGAEKIFIQFIKNVTEGSDYILNINHHIGAEIAEELGAIPVEFANRIFNQRKIKYPSFMRPGMLLKKIERYQADRVIIWDFVPNLPRKPRNGATIYYDHGCSWRFPLNSKTLGFFEKVDGCIAVSHASRKVMQERFKLTCPIEVVSNCVPAPRNIVNKQNEPGKKVVLGTASRLVSLKGIGVSVLTLQILLQRGYDASLYIAGKGPDEENLQALVKKLNLEEKVHFLGFQASLDDFYHQIDFYMSTPVTEPFGLSCMEALYHGVPVVFPLIDGQPELIPDGQCGLGISPTLTFDDYRSMTGTEIDFPHQVFDAVSETLMDPKVLSPELCAGHIISLLEERRYLTMSQNAQHHAQTRFDYDRFVKNLARGFACFVK